LSTFIDIVNEKMHLYSNTAVVFILYLNRCIHIIIEQMHLYCNGADYLYCN